ncbi:hypothetical protein L3X38_000854 [Prunus dulcis]|uniref:RRM domain-containing protein n=1 Tax=Prunus dulcis TaxID=3755 RepID=A0AAD4WT15_PRUDU|nr:hypothetical protein L3X38_000854 [Prunus dulcis]
MTPKSPQSKPNPVAEDYVTTLCITKLSKRAFSSLSERPLESGSSSPSSASLAAAASAASSAASTGLSSQSEPASHSLIAFVKLLDSQAYSRISISGFYALWHMGTPEAKYAAFEEKVKRTVYLDNISPQVTETVVRTALSQFGTVKNVQFIRNYVESRNIPQSALVEMENLRQADVIVSELAQLPFMMSGMPRPVRARRAEVEMFDDRPAEPGRGISCRWLEPNDPDFQVAQKLKRLTRKHAAEASFVLEQQLQEEENLAKQQNEALQANYKKYDMLDRIIADGTVKCLASHYNIRQADD